MPLAHSFAGGSFALDIGGSPVGLVKKFSGLGLAADIATHITGTEALPKKHVANWRYTPGRASVGINMGKGLYEWVQASMDKASVRRDGSFKAADMNRRVTSSLTFSQALLTEFTVPRLDGASKEPAYFDIAFDAERVDWAPGKGELLPATPIKKPKAWLTSNFKLSIGKLPCARVATVESFTWRCGVATEALGLVRPGGLASARVTVPDLLLSISMTDHAAWAEAARRWFVEGRHLEADEMNGRLSFLGPSLADTDLLGWIDLQRVGFKSFSHPDTQAGADTAARFTVGLYVEKMSFGLTDPGA